VQRNKCARVAVRPLHGVNPWQHLSILLIESQKARFGATKMHGPVWSPAHFYTTRLPDCEVPIPLSLASFIHKSSAVRTINITPLVPVKPWIGPLLGHPFPEMCQAFGCFQGEANQFALALPLEVAKNGDQSLGVFETCAYRRPRGQRLFGGEQPQGQVKCAWS
jgi:hypothetical protein